MLKMNNLTKNIVVIVFLLTLPHLSIAQIRRDSSYIVSYNKLSLEMKEKYISDFATQLSNDSDYVSIKKSMYKMQRYIGEMKKDNADSVKKVKGQEISYYRERGMSNPEDYLKLRSSIPKSTFRLMTRYPAYGKLDKTVMQEIRKKADKLISAN